MISGGDEIGRTQQGNNNAYCQDNPISWYDWSPTTETECLLNFTSRLIALRRRHPNLRRRKFFQDTQIRGTADISWYGPDGKELDQEAWESGWGRTLGMMLNGERLGLVDELGHPIVDDSFLLLLNAGSDGIDFFLPPPPQNGLWKCTFNTSHIGNPFRSAAARKRIRLKARSLILLCEQKLRTRGLL